MIPLSIDKKWYICFLSIQFIDGRLDLLNSGEGFSDVFEEEISMGEYAGKKLPVALLAQGFVFLFSRGREETDFNLGLGRVGKFIVL